MDFMGYRRPDGRVGIRNYVVLLPTSICSAQLAMDIANKVTGSTYMYNSFSCLQTAVDARQTFRTMVNIGLNGNAGAIIVVGLGCESVEPHKVAEELEKSGKTVACIVIQEEKGTLNALEKGCLIARKFVQQLSLQKRETFDVSELIIGVECRGADITSNLAAKPACGAAADILIRSGGTSILSKTTELIGVEHILANRAINESVKNNLLRIVMNCENRAELLGKDIRERKLTFENILGGITTIEEKALGCIQKAGKSPVQGVLDYAEIPRGKGLYVMDTPGQDIESIYGIVAGGAQIVIFATERGTPRGNSLVPVIKITANSKTRKKMANNIDIDASGIIEGITNIETIGRQIFIDILAVANGHIAKAEALGHKEFSIYKKAPTFYK